jgi:DNA-binding response OmpR family regulator
MYKILIVDDNERGTQSMRRALRSKGYDVVASTSPFQFRQLMTEEKPDLALVDVVMPALQGDMLVRIFNRHDADHRCPIILYSTLDPRQLEELARRSGADGVIHKTGDPDELVRELRRFLM